MKREELLDILKERFSHLIDEKRLWNQEVCVSCRILSPEEAIGAPCRHDLPILKGKDVMIQAEYGNGIGQAFTAFPRQFQGTLQEVLMLDIKNDSSAFSIFIAVLNAVLHDLGLCDRTVHCKGEGPMQCACRTVQTILQRYGQNIRVALIGYQPAMLEQLVKRFDVRVLDLDEENIGTVHFGVTVLDGKKDCQDTIHWADVILCTGSALCSQCSAADYLDTGKDVLFYGTTAAGAAALLGWERMCFAQWSKMAEQGFYFLPAGLQDKNAVMELYHRSMYQKGCTWSEDYPTEEIFESDVRRKAIFCLKHKDGRIAASVSIDEDPAVEELPVWTADGKKTAEIARLAVAEEYQGQGLTALLFTDLMEVLRNRGYKRLHFLVSPDNPSAVRAYRKMRFTFVGEIDLFGCHWHCYEGMI